MMDMNSRHGLPPINSADKPRKSRNWIYIPIILLLVGTNIFFYYKYQKNNSTPDDTGFADQSVAFNENSNESINFHYNSALAKLDQLTGQLSGLDRQLSDKNSEISQLKNEIETIISKGKITDEEFKKAQNLIKELNNKIDFYSNEVTKLKKENSQLRKDKALLERSQRAAASSESDVEGGLGEATAETAPSFTIGRVSIQPIALRRFGREEKETTKAKNVDIIRVVFDINPDGVMANSSQTFHIRIVDPNGKLLFNASQGSGEFTIKDIELNQKYTSSKVIYVKDNTPVKSISLDWEQSNSFNKGDYIIEIYHGGSLIGKTIRELR